MQQEVVKLWHKDHDLQGCDFILLPGGFSYGDYLRSGAISRFSPIMQEVTQHAERCGYVMDICSGFQILTEAGLLTKNSSATTYTSSQFPPICCLRSRWV